MSSSSATELPGDVVVADASRGGDTELPDRSAAIEELMQFRRWSIFLPRAYSIESEKNHVYIRSRHTGNPKFFDEMRARLATLLKDVQALQATGFEGAEDEVLESVLQAQWAALGFLYDRQFHKALTLGEFCRELVDTLAVQGEGGAGLLFWRLLVRINLGNVYAHFKRRQEALAIMKQALELVEIFSKEGIAANDLRSFGNTQGKQDPLKPVFGFREHVLSGAIYSHLSRIHLEAGDHEEALRLADLMVDEFKQYIWDLGDSKEDREAEACVLATAYSTRGVCDVHRGKQESALMWLQQAQECVEKHADLSGDSEPLLALIKDQVMHAKNLQLPDLRDLKTIQ